MEKNPLTDPTSLIAYRLANRDARPPSGRSRTPAPPPARFASAGTFGMLVATAAVALIVAVLIASR